MSITLHARQTPCDAAVAIPTLLRPALLRAARSVFAQEFDGSIHLLIGIDVAQGDAGILDQIRAECPDHVMLTILDLGYSTSRRHGGEYANHFSGALRTILSFQANSRLVAYLDDTDWYARHHLASMRAAIGHRDWVFCHRWLLDPATLWPICRDEWDAVGPGRGINQPLYGGFVHPSCLMVDKHAFHFGLPLWSLSLFPDGGGEDRLIFDSLSKNHAGAESPDYTSYCPLNAESVTHSHHTEQFKSRGLTWVGDEAAVETIQRLLGKAEQAIACGNLAETEAACRQALEINPYLPRALDLLAESLRRRGDIAAARDRLADAATIDDSDDERLMRRADLLAESGWADQAIELMLDNRRLLYRSPHLQQLFETLSDDRLRA